MTSIPSLWTNTSTIFTLSVFSTSQITRQLITQISGPSRITTTFSRFTNTVRTAIKTAHICKENNFSNRRKSSFSYQRGIETLYVLFEISFIPCVKKKKNKISKKGKFRLQNECYFWFVSYNLMTYFLFNFLNTFSIKIPTIWHWELSSIQLYIDNL